MWDVAGHERFGTMTRVYYKYAIAAIIVFDISRPATFDAVIKVNYPKKNFVRKKSGKVSDKIEPKNLTLFVVER